MANEKIKIGDVKPDGKYIVKVLCGGCESVLVESIELSGDDLKDSWANLVMTKGFNTPRCDKGCVPTFSDLNINSEMRIEEAKGE